MALVRAKRGVTICYKEYSSNLGHETESDVFALFFLVSPESDPTLHLRILSQIASRVDEDGFKQEWQEAMDEQSLKEALLHNDRFVSLKIIKENYPKNGSKLC